MKKVILLLALVICCAVSLFAQENKMFSYQAVIRDYENKLVSGVEVTVNMNISNSEGGPVVYSETHTTRSNINGLISLSVGSGTPTFGSWDAVKWNTAHVSVEITSGGAVLSSYSMPISAVPYSLYADYADSVNTDMLDNYLRDNGYVTSIDVQEAAGIPTNVSAFNNDAGYLTHEAQVLSIRNDTIFLTGGSFVKLPASTSQGTVNIPTNVSEFTNDAGYLTKDSTTIVNMQHDITNINEQFSHYYDKTKINDTLSHYYDQTQINERLSQYYDKARINDT
jgi:hypothetical protein